VLRAHPHNGVAIFNSVMNKYGIIKFAAISATIGICALRTAASTGTVIVGEYRESYFHDLEEKNSQVSGPFELALMDGYLAVRVLDIEDAYHRESYLVSDLKETYTVRTHHRLEDNNRFTLGDMRDGAFPSWNAWYRTQLLYLALLSANQPDRIFDGSTLKPEFYPEIVTKRASILKASLRTEVVKGKNETEIKFWGTATVPETAKAKAKDPKNTFLLASLKISQDQDKHVPSGAHFAFYRYVVSPTDGTFKHKLRTDIDFKMEESRQKELALSASYSGNAEEKVYVTDRRPAFQERKNFSYVMSGNEAPPYPALNQKRYDEALKRLKTLKVSAMVKENQRVLTVYALGAFSMVMAGTMFFVRGATDGKRNKHEQNNK
jgi:hypothetical protein